jgi:hypothetical protein
LKEYEASGSPRVTGTDPVTSEHSGGSPNKENTKRDYDSSHDNDDTPESKKRKIDSSPSKRSGSMKAIGGGIGKKGNPSRTLSRSPSKVSYYCHL